MDDFIPPSLEMVAETPHIIFKMVSYTFSSFIILDLHVPSLFKQHIFTQNLLI